ncbi:hypothetical protein [Novacetimonas hansenii]|uniref:hypothetical protein n=1 Tax=Novacetimonas hansenii TaxID=436 RepID=UPI001C4CE58F|nr:hypothetical protein [Novacetimonas hansenii]
MQHGSVFLFRLVKIVIWPQAITIRLQPACDIVLIHLQDTFCDIYGCTVECKFMKLHIIAQIQFNTGIKPESYPLIFFSKKTKGTSMCRSIVTIVLASETKIFILLAGKIPVQPFNMDKTRDLTETVSFFGGQFRQECLEIWGVFCKTRQ